jgi:hypothetical protein
MGWIQLDRVTNDYYVHKLGNCKILKGVDEKSPSVGELQAIRLSSSSIQ